MDDISKFIRIGTISSINPEKATARVLFEDKDNVVSREFKNIFSRTLGIQDYSISKVGEQVICLLLPNGSEEGFILGSYYTTKIKPPVNDENKRLIKFEDGTLIEYSDGEITINAVKDVNIIAAKNINIIASVSVNINGPAGITINGNLQVNGNINSSGSIIDTSGNTENHSH